MIFRGRPGDAEVGHPWDVLGPMIDSWVSGLLSKEKYILFHCIIFTGKHHRKRPSKLLKHHCQAVY